MEASSEAPPGRPPAETPVLHEGIYAWLAWTAVVAAVVLPLLALVGWWQDVEALKAGGAGMMPMMPVTAVGHLLAGLSLALLLGRHVAGARRRLGVGAAGAALAVGAVVALQYATGWDLGIDLLFFPESVLADAAPLPGRASLASAIGFVLAGLALVLLPRRPGAAQAVAALVLLIGLVALIGYAYGAERFYAWGEIPPTSFPSAVSFLAAALGLLFARPGHGPMAVVSRDDLGGYMARRLLPVAAGAPFLLGWIRVLGERAGLYDTLDGLMLVIVTATTAFLVLIWAGALRLHRLDTARRDVEGALRRSEERLRTTLDALPIGVWFTDETGRLVYGNPAGQRIWGGARFVSPEEFHEYKGWWPETGERIKAEEWAVARALRNREASLDEEIEIEAFDGTRKMLRNSAVPLVGPDGELQGAVILNEDITQRKRDELERERARAEAERRMREEAALRRATAAVAQAFTVAEVAKKVAQNAAEAVAADAVLVERIDEAAGEAEVVAATGAGVVRVGPRVPYAGSLAERAIDAGEPVVITNLREDPRVPEYMVRAFGPAHALVLPMTEGGLAIGALILARAREAPAFGPADVARATTFAQLAALAFRKAHLLEDSERKRQELERVLESQSLLVRGFSHDVKNPLGAADGHLALFEEGLVGDLTERQARSVDRARRSIHAALRLIDALVEFARAEAGQLHPRRMETDVCRLAEELLEEHRPAAAARGLALRLERGPRIGPLTSDPDRIRQIVGNLLSNAIKYTEQGGVTVRVADRDDGGAPGGGRWIAIEVADTGPGIPAERREEVFGEFTRLRPEAGPGAGLGLAISRKIARILGGEVTLSSTPGEGSTFTLWLPAPEASPAENPPAAGE